MWELIKLELRKALLIYGFAAVGVFATLIEHPGVLSPHHPALAFTGAFLGGLLAYSLFTDAPGTRAFLFSRPFTRRRLFLVRWGTGMVLIAVLLLAAATCLDVGLRQWAQVSMVNSPWYPMVRWHELSSLWSLACGTLLAYGATMWLLIKRDVAMVENKVGGGRYYGATGWFGLIPSCLIALAIITRIRPFGPVYPVPLSLGIAYTLLITVALPMASLHVYRTLPVES
jgi:hypothetical protein